MRSVLAIAAFCALGACGDRGLSVPTEPVASGFLFDPSSKPKLLKCPTEETKSTAAPVDPFNDGIVSLGGTSVLIPAGALLAPATIELAIPASKYMEIRVTANGGEHFVFEQPIFVTIDYSRCDLDELRFRPLTVWNIDPDTKALLENMGGIDNKLTQSITFSTPHLSGYAVAF